MRNNLSPDARRVLEEGETEAPFSGQYVTHQADGSYACVRCGNMLFSSEAKYDSGCGWPSFDQAAPEAVTYHTDTSHGMERIEVRCGQCDGHLGHVFNDGPHETTGKRYCINSVALDFKSR